jgi:hypothetical protein
MLGFKLKKEIESQAAAAKELHQMQQDKLSAYQQTLADAQNITDLGDRLSALENIKKRTSSDLYNYQEALVSKESSNLPENAAGTVVSGSGLAAIAGGIVLCSNPVTFIFGAAAIVAGITAGFGGVSVHDNLHAKRNTKDHDAYVASYGDFRQGLQSISDQAQSAIDAVVYNADLKDISKSTKFSDVYDKYSGIQKRFTAAAAAKNALGNDAETEAAPVINKIRTKGLDS